MRMIKRWMVGLGEWLVYMGREPVEGGNDALLDLARILTARQDKSWPDRDGECKRAAVYQQLTNSYPLRSKREVSRAIEDALCGE